MATTTNNVNVRARVTEAWGKLAKYFKDAYVELRHRTTFPTLRQTAYLTAVVASVSLFVSLFLWGADSILAAVVKLLLGR
jgi:preprotein translocase SecE subunit